MLFTALQGLTYPLLSLLLHARGVPEGWIGINAAMMPLGMVAAAPLAHPLVARLGPLTLLLASILTAVASLLAIGALDNATAWMPLRFVTGACLAWVFIVCDTWVNELAAERVRGRVLGLYSMSTSAGFALGPLLLAAIGTRGWMPFAAGATCGLAAVLPLWLNRRALPGRPVASAHVSTAQAIEDASLWRFVRAAPLLIAGAAATALADQVALSLLPIFCVRNGLSVREGSVALVSMIAGSTLMQYPMGWLADRAPVRAIFMGGALATALSALAMPLAVRTPELFWAVSFAWGGTYYGIFTLVLVMLGRRFSGAALVSGNAAFAATWGIGGLIGTPLAGGAMQRFGPNGFPASLAAVFLALALGVALTRERAPPGRA
ncbi:MAG TPA: MFS transporter [Steroidobacteraceae bacterium]|nr:MFS transporter [Steroidobacteraceae bacterium]